MREYLTAAHFTNVHTTRNVLGSFTGNPLPNLQINDLEAGEYTLQFQIIEPTIDGLGHAAYAIVHWKIKGQQLQRIISVFSGAVLGGLAEAVDVQILDQSGRGLVPFTPLAALTNGSPIVTLTGPVTLAPDEEVVFAVQPNVAYGLAGPANNEPLITLAVPFTGPTVPATSFYALARYVVGVSLSKGTRPTIMQPPVLYTLAAYRTVLATTTATVNIPPDAGIISVLTTVTVNGALTLQATAANGIVIFNRAGVLLPLASYIPQTFPGWFPVPPGAETMTLINNNAANDLNFSVQWGIEG